MSTPLPPSPIPSRHRWLLSAARIAYHLFLRVNGWRPVRQPSPLKGGGLVLRFQKTRSSVRYCVPAEEALQLESKFHHASQRR